MALESAVLALQVLDDGDSSHIAAIDGAHLPVSFNTIDAAAMYYFDCA